MQHIVLGPRARVALKWVGWTLLGLFSFVMGLQLTFPYERVRDKMVESLAARYDVRVGSVERGWLPGKMTLKSVTLTSRPEKAEDPPGIMYFDHITVDVDVLGSLLSWRLETDLDIGTAGGGTISGSLAVGKKDLDVSLAGTGVPAQSMPGLADMVGLPMSGKVDPTLKLSVDPNDWRQAKGMLRLACANCSVGDGKTKLKFKLRPGTRQSTFAQDGVTIDTVYIKKLLLQVDFGKGRMAVSKWELQSGDLEAMIELQVQLAKTLAASSVISGCVRYKPSEELNTRAAKTFAALMSTGAPLGPDSFYHIKLSGDLVNMKRLPRVCSGETENGDVAGRDFGRGGRVPGEAMPPGLPAAAEAAVAGEVTPPPIAPDGLSEPMPAKTDDVRSHAIDLPQPPPGAMQPPRDAPSAVAPPPALPPPMVRDEPAPPMQPDPQPGDVNTVEQPPQQPPAE